MGLRLPEGWSAVTREQRTQPTVAHALLHRSASFSLWTSPLFPPAALLFVWILWPHGNHADLLAWLAVVSVSSSYYFYVARRIVARLGVADLGRESLVFVSAYWSGGLCWGSLSLVTMPESDLGRGTLLSLVITLLAAGLIFAGQYAPTFYAYQFGATVLPMVAFARLGTSWGWTTTIFIFFASCFACLLSLVYRFTYTEAVFFGLRHRAVAEDLQRSVRELAHQATHDPLTGLPNRAGFTAALEAALDEGSSPGSPADLALLMIDLDQFKLVNDSLGHAAGDRLLGEVTARLAAATRPEDLLGRLGGDEFVVLARQVASRHDLEQIGARLLTAFDRPFVVEGRKFATTASIGATTGSSGTGTTTVSELLRQADAALYRAKDDGRNRCFVYDEALGLAVDAKLDRKAALERALADGSIHPWFQPIVDLESGAMVGAEALARWVDGPECRTAAEFMPLVEELGIASTVSRATMPEIRALHRRLEAVRDRFTIGVNVEPDEIADFLAQYGGGDLRGITIEITERGIIHDIEEAAAVLAEARAAGAQIALDDFGTGYSALALVASFPLDIIKLDRGLVVMAQENETARAIISGLVELAHRLGLRLIAEGVETPQQARSLLELGVTTAQGFLFSPAVPADQLGRLDAMAPQWLAMLDPSSSAAIAPDSDLGAELPDPQLPFSRLTTDRQEAAHPLRGVVEA